MSYVVTDTRWIGNLDPEAVGQELASIAKKNLGDLETDAIIARARSKKSVLHKIKKFSWNYGADNVTLDWDRHVARNVRRSVLVRFERENGTVSEPVPAFPTIVATKEHRKIEEVLIRPKSRALLISQLIVELRQLEAKLDAILDLGDSLMPIFQALDEELERSHHEGRKA